MIARISRILVDLRWGLALLGLVLATCLIAGLTQLSLDNRERAFFPSDDPIIERTDWLSERMGSSKDAMLLLYRPVDGDVLSPLSLSQLRTLTDEAARLPYVFDTHSLFDEHKTVIVRDTPQGEERLAIVSILMGADLFSDQGLEVLRDDLRAAPTVIGRSVARDFQTTVVTIQVDLTDSLQDDGLSRNERIDVLKSEVEKIEAVLEESEPGASLMLVGSGLFEHASTQVLRDDVRLLFPIFGVIFLGILFTVYRSAAMALGASAFVAVVIAATAGTAAWLGLVLSTLSVSGLLLVGTLAVADLIHVSNRYFATSDATSNQAAAKVSLERNLTPVFATSVTTIIGATALCFSPAEPIRTFATVIMVGVLLAFLFTMLFLPSLLVACRRRPLPLHQRMVALMSKMSRATRRHAKATLGLTVAISVVMTLGILQMKVDDDLAGWFDTSTEFRQGMDVLEDGYLSLRTITLATRVEDVDRNAALAAETPVDLGYFRKAHEDFDNFTTGGWLSIASAQDSWRKRVNDGTARTSFRPDRMALPVDLDVPSSRTLSDSGLLTQLEPGAADWTVAYFDAEETTTFELLRQVNVLERTLAEPLHARRETSIQGIPYAFAMVSAANFEGIAFGSLIAIGLVTLAMIAVFRSFRLALISLVPNVVPLIMIYGGWGWLTGILNMAAVGVFATAFGVIVDDTIHMTLAVQRETRENDNIDERIDSALQHSGSAILVTTILLAVGFFLLSLSDFNLTSQKSAMVGAAIVVALILDVLVLPVLLKQFARHQLARIPNV